MLVIYLFCMTEYKLGDSENIVDFSIIYKVSESLEKIDTYVVTEKLLNDKNLPLQKFLDFLQQKLPFEDTYYHVAQELWCKNMSIESDISLKHINSQLDNITLIKTDNELINLEQTKEQEL